MRKSPLYLKLNTPGDIDRIIKYLENYRQSIIGKNEEFICRLADIGVNAAMMTLATKGQGDAERDADFNIEFEVEGEKVNGIISISSEPKETDDGRVFYPHLAWEFGAGNRFNGSTSPNPKASELGMGPGTFPEQKHIPNPGFWYYKDDNGDAVRSYGTQAIMPMYTASIEILERINEIAREVFGNG